MGIGGDGGDWGGDCGCHAVDCGEDFGGDHGGVTTGGDFVPTPAPARDVGSGVRLNPFDRKRRYHIYEKLRKRRRKVGEKLPLLWLKFQTGDETAGDGLWPTGLVSASAGAARLGRIARRATKFLA